MKIVIDAFGGDYAPKAALQGCAIAKDLVDSTLIVCGDEQKIRECAAAENIDLGGIEILDAPDVLDIHEDPKSLLKAKSNSSMAVGLKYVADGNADAFVSAGSTGGVMVGGTFITKRIKGIKRPALSPIIPSMDNPFMLIDSGANLDMRPEFYAQFALMGSIYMEKVMGVKNPRVGLLNIGAEETKGGEMLVEAYGLLKEMPINFIGNVEAREVPFGACDVLVADGFSGNIFLKTYEGAASAIIGLLKGCMMKNLKTKLAALALKPALREMKSKIDYSEYGGAPLLGSAKPVFKTHGNSDANTFKNAILNAEKFAKAKVPEEIASALSKKELK
jgi:glycerol-3-phosphate acyltransferase PlsX